MKLIVGVLESDELVIPLLQFLFGGFGYIDRVELLLGYFVLNSETLLLDLLLQTLVQSDEVCLVAWVLVELVYAGVHCGQFSS